MLPAAAVPCVENATVTSNPWPMSVGSVLLREAREGDIEPLLLLRNDPRVNRFMLRTYVEPEV